MNHTPLELSRKICVLTDDFNESEFVWWQRYIQMPWICLPKTEVKPEFLERGIGEWYPAMILEELLDWLGKRGCRITPPTYYEKEFYLDQYLDGRWETIEMIGECKNMTEAASKAVLTVLEQEHG